jgi:flavin-dependent dehydrogenase
MHLLTHGYVGLCRLNNGEVNVCGLFRRPVVAHEPSLDRHEMLRGVAGSSLRQRLGDATFDESSFCSVAGLSWRHERAVARGGCCIGDAITMIPPVTGNGMSMAFESAELAIEPLVGYSRGKLSWAEACRIVARACDRAFAGRLAWAKWLQRLMFAHGLRGGLRERALRSEWLWRFMFSKTR